MHFLWIHEMVWLEAQGSISDGSLLAHRPRGPCPPANSFFLHRCAIHAAASMVARSAVYDYRRGRQLHGVWHGSRVTRLSSGGMYMSMCSLSTQYYAPIQPRCIGRTLLQKNPMPFVSDVGFCAWSSFKFRLDDLILGGQGSGSWPLIWSGQCVSFLNG